MSVGKIGSCYGAGLYAPCDRFPLSDSRPHLIPFPFIVRSITTMDAMEVDPSAQQPSREEQRREVEALENAVAATYESAGALFALISQRWYCAWMLYVSP